MSPIIHILFAALLIACFGGCDGSDRLYPNNNPVLSDPIPSGDPMPVPDGLTQPTLPDRLEGGDPAPPGAIMHIRVSEPAACENRGRSELWAPFSFTTTFSGGVIVRGLQAVNDLSGLFGDETSPVDEDVFIQLNHEAEGPPVWATMETGESEVFLELPAPISIDSLWDGENYWWQVTLVSYAYGGTFRIGLRQVGSENYSQNHDVVGQSDGEPTKVLPAASSSLGACPPPP